MIQQAWVLKERPKKYILNDKIILSGREKKTRFRTLKKKKVVCTFGLMDSMGTAWVFTKDMAFKFQLRKTVAVREGGEDGDWRES
jgi:hypothetical protein